MLKKKARNRGKERKPTASSQTRIKDISKYLSVPAFCLAIFTGYWNFKPNVSIDYAANFLPDNSAALPVRVTNNGPLPICVTQYTLVDNVSSSTGIYAGNTARNDLFMNVPSRGSTEFVIYTIGLHNIEDPPSQGSLSVTVLYNYWRLPKLFNFSIRKQFILYRNKDGSIRWLAGAGT